MAKVNPWKITGYKAGQNVVCRVSHSEGDGYAVIIPKDNLPGFIRTTATLRPGEELLCQFICVHNNRVLLSPLFSGNLNAGASLKTSSVVNWQDHLDNPDQVDEMLQEQERQKQASQGYSQDYSNQQNYSNQEATQDPYAQNYSNQEATMDPAYGSQGHAYAMGDSQAVQPSPFAPPQQPAIDQTLSPFAPPSQSSPMDPNQAQWEQPVAPPQAEWQQPEAQWQAPVEHTPTKKFRLKRAIDLVMPPLDEESLKTFRMVDYDLEWLITDLEGGMRTGCMKATSEQRLSRSAALLYRGKAVGCIYGCKSTPEAKPTEESLYHMLQDLDAEDTVVTIYDLPEEVTIAMSALFLGFPVQREDNLDARGYFDYVANWFSQNNSTACLAVSVESTKSTYLIFVHKGKFCGAFFVEEHVFTEDINAIYQLLAQPGAKVEASLLKPEMIAAGMRFGYSLTMAKQKRAGF